MSNVCCLQEVRWTGQVAQMPMMVGGRYRLWWCGKGDGVVV